MENIIIIGSSGHARVVIDIIERGSKYKIVGLIDSYAQAGDTVLGYKILGDEHKIPELLNSYNLKGGIIAIGDNWDRHLVYQRINDICKSFNFINAIDPTAVIGKNVTLGKGIVIMPAAVVNCNSQIDDFCIINTKASLDHDSHMKSFSSLAPGVTTGGYVEIGFCSVVCIGANVIPKIIIGENSVIGGGSFVNKSIPDNVVAFGIPVKIISHRKKEDKYL